MSALVNASINVAKIPKDELIKGEKGSYLNVTVSLNDETDQYGNNASIYVAQSKEEREAGEDRTYLGNGRVVWTDGSVQTYQKEGEQAAVPAGGMEDVDDELPF